MAKIQLSESNGQFISEAGEKILLVITKTNYDTTYGKVEIELKNERGEVVNNNFNLIDNDGEQSEGAIKAFSYFGRAALGDWKVEEIDPDDLVGKFIRADITMKVGTKPTKSGNSISFANIEKCYMTEDRFEVEQKKPYPKNVGLPSGLKAKAKAKPAQAAKAAPTSTEDDDDWND